MQAYAVHLSKSGKKAEVEKARNLLEDTYKQYKNGSTGLNLGMACVELLMFQVHMIDFPITFSLHMDLKHMIFESDPLIHLYGEKILL